MAKADRIVVRLEAAMRASLHAKAAVLGLDDAAFVRMLIHREMNGVPLPVTGQWPGREKVAMPSAAAAEELSEESVEEFEVPPDADGGAPSADLEELLTAGASMLDDMLARTKPQGAAPLMSSASARRGYQQPAPPSYGPGSRTRVVGVNDQAIGANQTGDGRGNVLRDNMRHLGIVGTRSR